MLVPGRQLSLPAARAGSATTAFHGRVIVAGGLSGADVSTDTVFELSPEGTVASLHSLPSAIHDAAAATLGRRLLVFGGGVSEGSDHIVQLFPGPSRQVGTLPQALSDVVAAEIAGTAYVAGGWNGTDDEPHDLCGHGDGARPPRRGVTARRALPGRRPRSAVGCSSPAAS